MDHSIKVHTERVTPHTESVTLMREDWPSNPQNTQKNAKRCNPPAPRVWTGRTESFRIGPVNETPHPDLERILFSAEDVAARIQELAADISRDYAGQEVHLIGVLRGAVPFIADLARCLTVPATVDYLAVSSYGAGSASSGVVRITKDLDDDIESRHVLIVEDILDSGRTLDYLVSMLRRRRPAELEVCTLLDKPGARETGLQPRYVGFTCPDCFVVGYGLDYAQRYRELPYIGELKREVYSGR